VPVISRDGFFYCDSTTKLQTNFPYPTTIYVALPSYPTPPISIRIRIKIRTKPHSNKLYVLPIEYIDLSDPSLQYTLTLKCFPATSPI
jgi:hypothetical protein